MLLDTHAAFGLRIIGILMIFHSLGGDELIAIRQLGPAYRFDFLA